PQLRRAPGSGWPDAPGVAGDGRRGRGDRAAGRCQATGVTSKAVMSPTRHVSPTRHAGHDSQWSGSEQVTVEVAPLRIVMANKPCLPGTRPFLGILLALNGRTNVVVSLEIDQVVKTVSLGE